MNKLLAIIYLNIILVALAETPTTQLQHADAAARQALSLAPSSPDAAEQWRTVCACYEGILASGDFSNGGIYYNLGNAYAQLGDIPRAILNYRRAQLFLPRNRQLQANLQYVRAKRQDHFAEPEASPVLQTLFFWHYDLAFHSRLWTAAVLAAVFWLAAIVLIWHRPAWLKVAAAILLLAALACGLSSFISIYTLRHARPAVILATEATPRKGDGNSYAAAFDAPLHAGTEVVILRTRGDWHEIALPNHLTGWLPDSVLQIL